MLLHINSILSETEINRRKKISETMTGRKLSASHIAHVKEANRGKKRSEETKKRIRETLKRKGIKPPSRKGTTITEWHKNQIRKALKGVKQTPEHIQHVLESFKFRKPTSIELKVQKYLFERKIDFEQQKIVGKYIADIYVPFRNLIIECDGTYWHSRDGAKEGDEKKNNYYYECGYNLIRLKERSIVSGSFIKLLDRELL